MKFDFDIDKDLVEGIADYNDFENEKICEIDIVKILPSPFNPIPLYSEEKEKEMVESIKLSGVRSPVLVRPAENGFYELVDGHNRVNCAKIIGLSTIPAIVKDYSDEDAKFINLDAIIQQRGFEDLKPSQRAKVIHALVEEVKKERLSLNLREKMEGDSEIAGINNLKQSTKYMYLKFYKCCSEIKEAVDEGKLALTVATELSEIEQEQQKNIWQISQDMEKKIDAKAAKLFKEKARQQELTDELIEDILLGKKRRSRSNNMSISVPADYKIRYFEGKSKKEIEDIVIKALTMYFTET